LVQYKDHPGHLSKIPRLCKRYLKWSSSFYAVLAVKQVSRLISVGSPWDNAVAKSKVAQPTASQPTS